ncbi:hypothetical protein JX265_007266 [Neoarthrinium moseri]|uniref:Heterokaryon incompatibility domain-containing protein n=1 Tax=Neoarthrinium moseri TaxID=1658444 RepID=A0A9P9WK00_9PEZI|nr:uncharacterized protein JN550_012103 [Neoarthrinium moseri]KAI1850941.1 hypothetical protein JX266_003606 [Neoarthrinium moseri]KAI1859294.1 hypothetical protein JN550_012103 [Neoarthrinium moseri]KAI1867464.1 hypothetical protein JX265_007266 [Neoarthrinium moseri]
MASIYAGSTVTIAATMSVSDLEGFTALSPPEHISRKFTYLSETGIPHTFHARKTLAHGHTPKPYPLLTRGWVLQERLLSPRVVHFTRDEIIWECMERTTCECGCIRFLWSPGWVPFNKNLLHEPNLSMMSRAELNATWHQIVQEYSRLNLTFSRDRLPAISGAARILSQFQGSAYYAGLWRASFVRDMMWKRHGSSQKSKKLDKTPSWSWASINAEVTYNEDAITTTEMVAVMDIIMEPIATNDQFGTVRGGLAVLSGFLVSSHQVRAMLRLDDQEGDLYRALQGLGALSLDVDEYSVAESNIYFFKLSVQTLVSSKARNQEVSIILLSSGSGACVYRRVGLLERTFEGPQPEIDIYKDVDETTTVSIV